MKQIPTKRILALCMRVDAHSNERLVDFSELPFDFTSLLADYPDKMAVIEVRSGVNIIELAENDRINIRDFGVLTASMSSVRVRFINP